MQICDPSKFDKNDLFRNLLLNVCAGIETCHLERQKTSATVMYVVADL